MKLKIIKTILILILLTTACIIFYSFRWISEKNVQKEEYSETLMSKRIWEKLHPLFGRKRSNCEFFSFKDNDKFQFSTCFPSEPMGKGISWKKEKNILKINYKIQSLFEPTDYYYKEYKIIKLNEKILVLKSGIKFFIYKSAK